MDEPKSYVHSVVAELMSAAPADMLLDEATAAVVHPVPPTPPDNVGAGTVTDGHTAGADSEVTATPSRAPPALGLSVTRVVPGRFTAAMSGEAVVVNAAANDAARFCFIAVTPAAEQPGMPAVAVYIVLTFFPPHTDETDADGIAGKLTEPVPGSLPLTVGSKPAGNVRLVALVPVVREIARKSYVHMSADGVAVVAADAAGIEPSSPVPWVTVAERFPHVVVLAVSVTAGQDMKVSPLPDGDNIGPPLFALT